MEEKKSLIRNSIELEKQAVKIAGLVVEEPEKLPHIDMELGKEAVKKTGLLLYITNNFYRSWAPWAG